MKEQEARIEQLEKEMEIVKKRVDYFYETIRPVLEKENAGLKARLHAINLLTPELEKMSKLKNQQLTKAKEILRSLYFIIQSRIDYKNNIEIADEMWRAEQFLKDIKEG